MLKYVKKYWMWCLLAPLFMVGEISVDLIQPALMADIVDNGVLEQNLELIKSVGLRMISLVMLGGCCGITCGVFAQIASQNFSNDLRKDLFKKIMDLSFEQTDKISTGSLVTRLTNDVTQVQNMLAMSIRGVVRSSIMFGGGIFMLWRQSYKFAMVVAAALPVVIGLVVFFMKKASPMFSVIQERLDGVNNVMQENVAGSRVVKAYVKEEYEKGRFDEANDSLCSINLKVQGLLAFLAPSMNIILNICVVGIIMIGGITVKNNGTMTPGEIMAAITYVTLILHSIVFLANIFQTFTRAKASAKRINEVLECTRIIEDGGFDKETDIKGRVEFRKVSFAYPDSSGKDVLENINLTIQPGETFGILGATGSGKTSLVSLIPRFYDVNSGQVLVDGIDVKEYDLKALRDKIAIVMQKAELYSRPIEANIRWGRDDASPYEIKKASIVAQADDFICAAEDGYYTQVTEGGHSLSGGQKQRISIARAILKNSEILIFDDSTSALDLKTEAGLYGALKKECPKSTKIIIAQRIASVKGADRIAVIDDGNIAALGTYRELFKNSQIFKDIYNSQMKKGDEEDE